MANVTDKTKKSVSEGKLVGLKKHSEEINGVVKESLRDALIVLVSKKPYDKITITELCAKAGVSRMAFYSNFDSKDEILKEIIMSLQDELVERYGSPFRSAPSYEWYIGLLTLAKEKSSILIPIFYAGFLSNYIELTNKSILRHKDISSEEKFIRLLWSGGVINIIVRWLIDGMKETPEEMAGYCMKYLVSFNAETCIQPPV
ncbi:MAG: TetR/AcrR family transcriptional regulator [Candidatus Coproplasma sp.]